MIKGSQKQLIVLRTGGSRYFDEAYFVLRREVKPSHYSRGDILVEANRILEENTPSQRAPKRRVRRAILCFLCGLICGACICAAIFLIA